MLKLNGTGLLLVLMISFFLSACRNNGRQAESGDLQELECQANQAEAVRTNDPNYLKRLILFGDRSEVCNTIKRNPDLLNRYHDFMQQDPSPDDIGNFRLIIYNFVTNSDGLVVEPGEKITHPVFDREPALKTFITKILAAHKIDLDLEEPLDSHGVTCWGELIQKLEDFSLPNGQGGMD